MVLWELGEHGATLAECQSQSVALSWRTGRWSLFCSPQPVPFSFFFPAVHWLSMPRACCSSEWNRQGVLADRGSNCSFYLGCPGRRAAGRKDSTSAMGQLCCFPFSRDEEKISELEIHSSTVLQRYTKDIPSWPSGDKNGGEPDDAELVRLSKRLVENAVLKAVQQYLEETQNKNKPGNGNSVKTEEANRNGTDSDNMK
ncbi:A-kinase anchoring protein 7 isoform X5 [Talpa occidentalis]|uniref:A-kinase anchoring protein 7 isoform X5 n=1 Tax=Talpa occidentalis TaxID=50954 RepID=UPI00188F3509|nr:A-kinase anchoring protein 7 isoform X5 [Talpa occidentalis]